MQNQLSVCSDKRCWSQNIQMSKQGVQPALAWISTNLWRNKPIKWENQMDSQIKTKRMASKYFFHTRCRMPKRFTHHFSQVMTGKHSNGLGVLIKCFSRNSKSPTMINPNIRNWSSKIIYIAQSRCQDRPRVRGLLLMISHINVLQRKFYW